MADKAALSQVTRCLPWLSFSWWLLASYW